MLCSKFPKEPPYIEELNIFQVSTCRAIYMSVLAYFLSFLTYFMSYSRIFKLILARKN